MNESNSAHGRPVVAPRRVRRVAAAGFLAVAVPGLCGALSLAQTARWRGDLTLYNHCLAVNPRSVMANHNAGCYLADRGMLREACGYYLEALRTDPSRPETHYSLSVALGALGYRRQAERHLREALRLRPDWAAWIEAESRHRGAEPNRVEPNQSEPNAAEWNRSASSESAPNGSERKRPDSSRCDVNGAAPNAAPPRPTAERGARRAGGNSTAPPRHSPPPVGPRED